MVGYATGKYAWGTCGRSGKRLLLNDMIEDGQIPGMLVDPAWYEPKHPQDLPVKLTDNTALRNPTGDLDRVHGVARLGPSIGGPDTLFEPYKDSRVFIHAGQITEFTKDTLSGYSINIENGDAIIGVRVTGYGATVQAGTVFAQAGGWGTGGWGTGGYGV